MAGADRTVLGIDLGKTLCRLRLVTATATAEASSSGAAGFAGGSAAVDQALRAVQAAQAKLRPALVSGIDRVGIGAAGVDADRGAAQSFAITLRERFACPVMIVSDALAAHAGALGGAAGSVLIAGTGAAAFHVSSSGERTRADGWGVWLGDLGSGRWIGQEGLRRALRAHDGIGLSTSLLDAARELAGGAEKLPRYVSGAGVPERVLAAFAPTVLDHAQHGDAVATHIVAEAVAHLADTAAAVTPRSDPIAVTGGLTGDDTFHSQLADALAERELRVVPTLGDATSGALLLASDQRFPHERYAIRV